MQSLSFFFSLDNRYSRGRPRYHHHLPCRDSHRYNRRRKYQSDPRPIHIYLDLLKDAPHLSHTAITNNLLKIDISSLTL